MIRRITVIFAA